jgi:RNA polymerase sigma-70 factor (ECF subfamily)
MTDPEFALIDRILAGNQAVYAELVDRHKNYAFTIACKILENRAEAEEAAQDAFIKAYHHLKNFKRDAKFSTWLYRIVFNTAVSYKRKHKVKFQDIETTVVGYGQEAEGILERNDKKKFIRQAMDKLNEADKLAITLFYLEEFSLEEIAEITGMQANTAKVRVHRARQRLAEELTTLLKKEALTL